MVGNGLVVGSRGVKNDGIVAGGIPLSVGAALSNQLQGLDRVVLSLIQAYLGKGGFASDLPFGSGKNEGAWYGDVCAAGNTAYLIMAERSLARLAEVVGDQAMASRRQKRIAKALKQIVEVLDPDQRQEFAYLIRTGDFRV